MTYLAHKISRAKWAHLDFMKVDDIGADALTVCLRTRENQLSFWRCDSTNDSDVEEVVLALAGGMDRLDTIDIVLIPNESFDHSVYQIEPSPGKTAVKDLRNLHVDIIELTAKKLCRLIPVFAANVRNDSTYFRIKRSKVRDMLNQALKEDRIDLDTLSFEIYKYLDHIST